MHFLCQKEVAMVLVVAAVVVLDAYLSNRLSHLFYVLFASE
jgi:hypothetical protein